MADIPSSPAASEILVRQLQEMGFDEEKIAALLKRQNAPWKRPDEPGFSSLHLTCNAHIHPATVTMDGVLYRLAKSAQYIPCAANVQDVVDAMDILNCQFVVLKGQTCFGTDNTSLLDTLRYCDILDIGAAGIATVDEKVTDDELGRLKDAGVIGVRHAFLSHIADASSVDKFKATVSKITDRIAPFGFVTNLYFEGKNIEPLNDMVLEVAQKTPVTLDHMCRINPNHPEGLEQPEFKALCALINAGDGRIHVLLSGPDRATKSLDSAEWAKLLPYKNELATRFPDWVSVGTDFNHPNSDWGVPNDGDLWNWCRKGMSGEQWYKASYANPLKFFFGREVARFNPALHDTAAPAPREAGRPGLE